MINIKYTDESSENKGCGGGRVGGGGVYNTSKGCGFDGKNGRRCRQITLRWQNETVTGITTISICLVIITQGTPNCASGFILFF